jgi:hypothetical protein
LLKVRQRADDFFQLWQTASMARKKAARRRIPLLPLDRPGISLYEKESREAEAILAKERKIKAAKTREPKPR